MVYVARDDGAAGGDFTAHKFRRDLIRDIGPEAFSIFIALIIIAHLGAGHIFADGDKFHLFGDDAVFGILILRHHLAWFCTQRVVFYRKFAGEKLSAGVTIIFGLHIAALIFFHIAALVSPFLLISCKTGININFHIFVGVWPRRIINSQVFFA